MKNIDLDFTEAYLKSPDVIKRLIDSEKIGNFSTALRTTFKNQTCTKEQLVLLVTNYCLHNISAQETLEYLVSSGTSNAIALEIISLIETFITKELNGGEPEARTLYSSNKGSLASEIAETEAVLAHLSPIRTMAKDMHDLQSQAPHEETTYRSAQDQIITPKNPAAAPASRPHWDSESTS